MITPAKRKQAIRYKNFLPKIKRGIWLFIILLSIFFSLKIFLNQSVLIKSNWRKYIALHTSPAVIWSPPTAKDAGLVLTLPKNLFSQVPYGYGEYRLNNVWRLGELEKKPDLYAETLGDTLGIKIDAWIGKGDQVLLDDRNDMALFADIQKQFFINKLITDEYQTNLPLVDKIIFEWKLLSAKPDNYYIYQWHQDSRLFSSQTLPDKTDVKKANLDLIDQEIGQILVDTDIRQGGWQIEIFNTTETVGAGQQFSRFISNIGGKVVSISNSNQRIKNCTISASAAAKDAKIIQYLASSFACDKITQSLFDTYDISIFVGETFAQRWLKY